MKENKKTQNIIDDGIDVGRFFELALTDKKYVTKLNLHEIKNEILLDYTSDFELNGLKAIGPVERKTSNRFTNYE